MNKPKIYAHGSYIGNTGFNHHTRDFFRALSKYSKIKVRNFTIGNTWNGNVLEQHSDEPYFNEVDKSILYEQILWNSDGSRSNYPIYPDKSKDFTPDVNIVLCETNHHIFYDEYKGPMIAYNVWESTLQPENYFKRLLEFDELWVPSKWQKDCTIAQGYPEDKIKVVPEGVDVDTFFPESTTHEVTSSGFNFFLAGRWDYRKSIKEIIETFIKTFDKDEPVNLIVSVDNPFSGDGLKSTEDRLKHYDLEDDRIKILHFPPRQEYIKILKSSHVFVSCARSEGWNLPLIEAMSCGIPSIYSNCSGQLEFAEGKGIPVNIIGEKPVSESSYNLFSEEVGNYYEPNFDDLSIKMRDAYTNYKQHKDKALDDSKLIHSEFNWDHVAQIGQKTINEFLEKKSWLNRPVKVKEPQKNNIRITYLDGPRVEIIGDEELSYLIEFINGDTNEIVFSDTIKNNMWTACGKKYYIPWKIRINGEIRHELNLENETVIISMETRSIGDTIAYAPFAIEFAKKHKCKVLFSTFHNEFFEGSEPYKDIQFIKPGEQHNCAAVYKLGWFRLDGKWGDTRKNPNQVNLIPLQQTASDILGLEYKEINYGLSYQKGEKPIEKEYVVFAPSSTMGSKEWDYNSWVQLSKLVKELGYEVITVTDKPYYIEGVTNVWGEPLSKVANYLHHAKTFIGLGSGLSWFNWGLGKYTYMINGFARPWFEFTTNVTKIYNDNVCVFCGNDEMFVFDGGDWDWCPIYQGTKKQHICQKSITPLQVFNNLDI
jgi:autotransporter strand-loop-strand O-heptosyltransferase